MNRPKLRAEGIIFNDDKTKILVQCDLEESFYRLPGGSIEFGETSVSAINREFLEEFELVPNISELACVNESIIKVNGKQIHQCTLIHWGSITEEKIIDQLIHKEHPEIKLIWRTNEQLQLKPLYPEGILDIIVSDKNDISHLLIEKSYD